MYLLGISIVIALLFTIALPIVLALLFNKKSGGKWKVTMYGVLAYFVVQSLLTLVMSLLVILVENEKIVIAEQVYRWLELGLHVLFAAIFGVAIRWAAMRYMKEGLDNLPASIGIGLGYGGIESILIMGLPLLVTFINMLRFVGDDLVVEAWSMSALVPIAIALERLSAIILHLNVTVLIFQFFKRKNIWWIVAAIWLEVLFNGVIIGLAESRFHEGWVMLSSVLLMLGNLYMLYRFRAFDFQKLNTQKTNDLNGQKLEADQKP